VGPFSLDFDDLLARAESSFYAGGLPGCVGAIDGTMVPIKRPRLETLADGDMQTYYYAYKQFHSVNILTIVDAQVRFSIPWKRRRVIVVICQVVAVACSRGEVYLGSEFRPQKYFHAGLRVVDVAVLSGLLWG
jgi:glutamine synthetase